MLSQVREKAGKIQDATQLATLEDAIRRLDNEFKETKDELARQKGTEKAG